MSGPLYPPNPTHEPANDALELLWPLLQVGDAVDFPVYNPYQASAKWFGQQVIRELRGLIYGAGVLADKLYAQALNCHSTDAIGAPVRFTELSTEGALGVTTANALTKANANVIGFIKSKPTDTTCYIQHFRRFDNIPGSGGSEGDSNQFAYLRNDGSIGPNPGTFVKALGLFDSDHSCYCVATPERKFINDLADANFTNLTPGDSLVWNGALGWNNVPSTSTDDKFKTDAADPTSGYANAKVDNATLEVDTSGHKVRVKDNGVTYTKIQQVSATDKILGRQTAGAGNVEEIPCTGAARTFLSQTTVALERSTLGLDTGNSPQFTGLTLTGSILEYKDNVVSKTANYSLLQADSGTVFNNTGASGDFTFTLPTSPAIGTRYEFWNTVAHKITVATGGSDNIYDSAGSTHTSAFNSTVGRGVILKYLGTNLWTISILNGSWSLP